MAKLVDVFRNDKKQKKLGRRQLPLVVDENLTVRTRNVGLIVIGI